MRTLLFYVVLAFGVRYAVISQLHTAYLGGYEGDAGLYIWLSKTFWEHFTLTPWYSTSAFYPYQTSLAWSDNYLFPSFITQLFTLAGISYPLSYNLTLFIALSLNGWCAYLFAKEVIKDSWWAHLAGVFFSTASFLSGHLGHPQLQWAFFIPLGLYFFEVAWSTRKKGYAVALGITLGLSFLSAVYYAIFLGFCCAVLWTIRFFQEKKWKILKDELQLMLCAIFGILPFLPAVYPYLLVRKKFGARYLFEASSFAATPSSFLSAPPFNWWYSNLSSLSHAEAHLFPGIVILLFGVIGSIKSISSQRNLLPYTFLAFFAAAVCFGPAAFDAKFPLTPFGITATLIPGFNGIRAIGRLGIVTLLLLAVLAASFLSSYFSSKKGKMLLIPLTLLVLGENFHTIIPLQTETPRPQIFDALVDLPPGEAVVLPFFGAPNDRGLPKSWTEYAIYNVNYMNWNVGSGKKLVNGYSGIRPPSLTPLLTQTSRFPDERSMTVLSELPGVKYLVVVVRYLPDFKKTVIAEATSLNSCILKEDGEGNVLIDLACWKKTHS